MTTTTTNEEKKIEIRTTKEKIVCGYGISRTEGFADNISIYVDGELFSNLGYFSKMGSMGMDIDNIVDWLKEYKTKIHFEDFETFCKNKWPIKNNSWKFLARECSVDSEKAAQLIKKYITG